MTKTSKRFGTSRKFPRWKSAVLLGTVEKISVFLKDEIQTIFFKKKPMLLSSVGGSQLLIMFASKTNVDKTAPKKAGDLWSAWSGFEVGDVLKISVKSPLLHKLGRAKDIVYSSDKWTGKKRSFIHTFDTPPIVWVDTKKNPRIVLITGGKLSVKKEGITG